MNSWTIRAPSSSALRAFASRWAGIKKPSSVPPRSACSRVETRRLGHRERHGRFVRKFGSRGVECRGAHDGLLTGVLLGVDPLAHP